MLGKIKNGVTLSLSLYQASLGMGIRGTNNSVYNDLGIGDRQTDS
jgi:hypothetical protein